MADNNSKYLSVLIQGVLLAQSKGVYSLQDAAKLAEAVQHFMPQQETLEKIEEEPKESDSQS